MKPPLQTSVELLHASESMHVTMSSREIASLVKSRHDKVKQSIERLAMREAITLPPVREVSFVGTDGRTKHTTEYRISKRDSYVIVAQLSPEFTARLVDRWQELEKFALPFQVAIPQTFSEALRLAADLAEKNTMLVATVAEQTPKVEALARIATAHGALTLSAAAKVLQLRPIKFCESLRQMGWIYRRLGGKCNLGYQDKVHAGWLTHKVCSISLADGREKIVEQVLVTPRGLAKLAILLGQTSEGAQCYFP